MKATYKRPLKNVVLAPLEVRNLHTLVGIFREYNRPISALFRYLRHSGEYPKSLSIRGMEKNALKISFQQAEDELTFCSASAGKGISSN